MNERQARERGYEFSGNYSWDKEEIKHKIASYRKAGFKALLVTIPPNPYSRGGHGPGYSAYLEPKYFLVRSIQDLTRELKDMPTMKKQVYYEYNNEINKISLREYELIRTMNKYKKELANL